jgi:O-antigen ligase
VYPQLRGRLRVPMVLMLALSSVFLVLTYTRTALLGTVIGLAVVGFLQSKRVLAGMGIAGLCALLLVPQLGARFEVLTQTDAAPNVESGNTLEWRLNYWSQVLPLSSRNPVTGIGLNMTQYNTPSAKQPHSDFVRAYVETGLIGLAAYLALLVVLVRTGRQAVRRTLAGTFDRGIAVGFLGCAVAFVAVSMAANIMSNVVTLWYLVTFAAAASVVARHPSSPEPLPIARRAWDPARD